MNSVRLRLRLCLCVVLCLPGCATQTASKLGSPTGPSILRGHAMGTTWRIVIADAMDDKSALEDQCTATLEALESQMSNWNEDSELSRFNRSDLTEPVAISRELAAVIIEAKKIYEASGGAFDITAAPLVSLWGFGPDGRRTETPDQQLIARARKSVGSSQLRLSQGTSSDLLSKVRSEVSLDLSGLAKGYAIDKLAELLGTLDVQDYLVEFGGELRASGLNSHGRPWRVGLERPDRSLTRESRSAVDLENMAIATSGNYRNFTSDSATGIARCHIIDPRTGRPVSHRLASVSVIAESAMTADAWATALMVLGPDEGFRRAQDLGLKATFLVESGHGFSEKQTDGFGAAKSQHKELVLP